ncbi:MAG TPA: hypothetical protein VKF38_14315 [Anaerolineaceae bacterium]|nr:hypothetical protein [Anaerolineaceae bacterium]
MKTIAEMILAFVAVASIILLAFGICALFVALANNWIGVPAHSSGITLLETAIFCLIGVGLFVGVSIFLRIFHHIFGIFRRPW